MTKKVKSTNRREHMLELPDDLLKRFSEIDPQLAQALQDRLKRIQEALPAQAGLRGQVNIANHMAMENNRIIELADPKGPLDAVNLQTLDEYFSCEKIVQLLEDCNEHAELLDDENDSVIESDSEISGAYFIGGFPFATDMFTGTGGFTANRLHVLQFVLPYSQTVSRVTFEAVNSQVGHSASAGLYDSNKSLICNGGVQSLATAGRKSSTFTATLLSAGVYYVGFSITNTLSMRSMAMSADFVPKFLNGQVTRMGTGGVTAGGALLSSFTTITAPLANQFPVIMFE